MKKGDVCELIERVVLIGSVNLSEEEEKVELDVDGEGVCGVI